MKRFSLEQIQTGWLVTEHHDQTRTVSRYHATSGLVALGRLAKLMGIPMDDVQPKPEHVRQARQLVKEDR